jgi:hypothetical protein
VEPAGAAGARRRRRWPAWLALALVALGVAAWLALPAVVRRVAIWQLRSVTGREATIDAVELRLLRGHARVTGVRLADRAEPGALLELDALDLRLHLSALFRGVVRIAELTLTGPRLRLVRTGPGELNVSDLLRRPAAEPRGAPAAVVVERLRVAGGQVTFEDRVLSPPHTIEAAGIQIEASGLSTLAGDPPGRAQAALTLAGAPVTLVAEGVGLAPVRARARGEVTALELAALWPYLAGGAIQPAGGRATLSVTLEHAPEGTAVAAELVAAGLALRRAAGAVPLAEIPRLAVTARDVVRRAGQTTLGHVELTAEPTVLDGSGAPPRRYRVAPLRVTLEGAGLAPGQPGRVSLEAGLPGGARLDVRGTADLAGRTARLAVVLAGVDASQLAPYVPPVSPVTVGAGRLGADLDVAYGPPAAIDVSGDVTARGLVLLRRDRREPFVTHPSLRVRVRDLAWRDGALAVGRLAVDSRPVVTDSTASPPVRAEFTRLRLVAEDATWPSRGPARVRLEGAVRDGGQATVVGTFDPGTLATRVRADLVGLDLVMAGRYLPPDAGLTVSQGRLDARLTLGFDRAAGLGLGGDVALLDLALGRTGVAGLLLEDRRVGLALRGLTAGGGRVALGRLEVTGAPTLTLGDGSPPRRLAFRGLTLAARDLGWPARGPAPIELHVALPEAGTLEGRGAVALGRRSAEFALTMRDAALGGLADWLVVTGPVSGAIDADLRGTLGWGGGAELTLDGAAAARALALGPVERPALALPRAEMTGLRLRWPGELRVARVTLNGLSGLVEREADGRFPLRAILAPRGRPSADAAGPGPEPAAGPGAPAAPPGPSPVPGAGLPGAAGSAAPGAASVGSPGSGSAASSGAPGGPSGSPAGAPGGPAAPAVDPAGGPGLELRVEEIAVEDGTLRFIDRSTSPFYSEELSRLAIRIRELTTAPDGEARLAIQGTLGATGTLDLSGRVAPFARPFLLEVEGELREFPLPRTNPIFRRLFAWLLSRGSLTTRVHYRIVGDRLEALHDVHLARLNVERDREPATGAGRIGLPLGLIVAVVTDARGDIAFPLPVQGRLGSPEFSLGGAIRAAVRNALMNLIAGPLGRIGRLFGAGEDEPVLRVDPLEFPAAVATIDPEGERHLQHVADFLRAAPNVALVLRAVVGEADVQALRTREVTARIQQIQREAGLETFEAAAAHAFREAFPDRPAPGPVDEIVEALRAREPVPAEPAARLAAERLAAARGVLVERAGVEAARLRPGPDPGIGEPGAGRVEFELAP